MFKKIVSLLLVFALTVPTFSMVAHATESNTSSVEIDGIIYQIDTSYDTAGNKVITVSDGTQVNTVVNDGESLTVTKDTLSTGEEETFSIPLVSPTSVIAISPAAYSAMKFSLYWNYNYYYSDASYSSLGMYFDLSSGNTYGSWNGYDRGNTSARSLAYSFCSKVNELDSAQWSATAASGSSGASIAAAILSAGPTAGIGTIIGIVAAILSGGVAVAEWVAAYNFSLDCNSLYLQFKQSL